MLRIENLTGIRGTEKLFQGINFDVQSGQMVWLRGANGSGKTTLLRMLTGISVPEVGEILWNGETLAKSEAFRRQLVYLGHSNGLKDDLTAMESLQFLTRIHGRSADVPALEEALKKMGVFHRRHLPVRMLSQGQRKRVALARLALETQPGVWVLDEPIDSLDDSGVAVVAQLLKTHLGRGGRAILTSHIPLQIEGVDIQTLQLEKRRAP
ncbi:MAG: cytochrome c biogenesis heme-transporting ATPase CcmA [Burkholderiales bacterium]|nr:cytochrome c biogenesis heme-transporting ATPase CcmA [Burkholderiales bacterium]